MEKKNEYMTLTEFMDERYKNREDIRQCCNPFPCPYIGKDKTCEECNCYREDFWGEDDLQANEE